MNIIFIPHTACKLRDVYTLGLSDQLNNYQALIQYPGEVILKHEIMKVNLTLCLIN
jgi:hypothetical protein